MSNTEDSDLSDAHTSLMSGDFHFNTPPRPRIEHYDAWQCNACLLLQLCKKKNTTEVPFHCPTCGSTDLKLCVMQLSDQGCGPHPQASSQRLTSTAAENELKSGDETSWVEDADGGFVTRDSLSDHSGSTVGQSRHDSTRVSPVSPVATSGLNNHLQKSPPWITIPKSPPKYQDHQAQFLLFEKRQTLLKTLTAFPPSGGELSMKEQLRVLDITQPLPLSITSGGRYDLLMSDDVRIGTGSGSSTSAITPTLELPLRPRTTCTPSSLAGRSDAEPEHYDGKGKVSARDTTRPSLKLRLHKSASKMQRIRALSAKVGAMRASGGSPPEANEDIVSTSSQRQTVSQKRMASTQVSPSIIKRLETEAARTTLLQQHLDTAIRQQERLFEKMERLLILFAHVKASGQSEDIDADRSSRGRRPDRTSPPSRAGGEWNFTVSADVLRSNLEIMASGKRKSASKGKVLPEHIRFDAIKDGKWYVMSYGN
ncbi:hypothetical protein LTR78_004930 [Recurvomyces mirabilis]|uniref:Uncharacterized protein n=1 Tax=Recurvomyces mirabilis TaxID=574656 RepID=A0AAE1C1R3_9PEZI|nr:hypothetical protein LTR78_004930 [Recurvomyces mirabilis]KAK5158453.1 hypothetical protein LTS14_003472 [Recurvomyces mirabilis]